MTKLEQMQEKARETNLYLICTTHPKARKALDDLITEVWNEAIKECEDCVPEEGIKWMQEGFNKEHKGYTRGFNSCRNQTLQAISKLRV